MQGKKVRENPLLEGLNSGNDVDGGNAGNAGMNSGGFGSQQQFQLKAYYGEAARAQEEEAEEGNKNEQPKKVKIYLT